MPSLSPTLSVASLPIDSLNHHQLVISDFAKTFGTIPIVRFTANVPSVPPYIAAPAGNANFTSKTLASGIISKVKVWFPSTDEKDPGERVPPVKAATISASSKPVTTTPEPTLLKLRLMFMGLSWVMWGATKLPTTPISPAPPL